MRNGRRLCYPVTAAAQMEEMQALNDILNYTFREKRLLKQALTHSSKEAGYSYERLEFLGDAVLELIVSAYLYRNYPDYDEGEMTAVRTQIVCEALLSAWAKDRGLGRFLILGKGEENSHGREKNSILCDVVEAIIGALYLDGGIEAAESLILQIISFYRQAEVPLMDAKTQLQELLQQTPNQSIEYQVVKTEGPPHDRTFFVEVYVNHVKQGSGLGKTKKQAEQAAAIQALKTIKSF